MTEEEKIVERELKINAVAELQTLAPLMDTTHKEIFDCDSRLKEYVNKVADNPKLHNLYEVLAVVRFFHHLSKYTFKISIFKQFCKFYEALKFSGTQGRTRYKLTPIQVFQYANIFGFEDENGIRLCRDAYILVPRKFSKTTSAASLAVWELFFGENNAQAYCCANSYNQAKILFDEIRNILLSIDPNGKHFKVNREVVSWKDGSRESFCRCLASNPKALDGLFASLCICDEFSQARNTNGKNGADLKNTITSSMGPRRSPLCVVITTASEVVDGPCYHEIEGVKAVLRGEMENDRIFASLFMPDCDDVESDPNTWMKVQPHMGVTVRPEFYQFEYQKALLSSENMMVFRTKLLNQFTVSDSQSWISAKDIRDCCRNFDLDYFQSGEFVERQDAMCAIDLSESGDFSCVTIGVYVKRKSMFYFHTAYFMPKGSVNTHANRALIERWHNQGHLILTDGDVIDYSAIVNYILDANEKVRILRICYDSWKSTEMLNQLSSSESGVRRVLSPYKQTYGAFTAPVQFFEHALKTGQLVINNNPINQFVFSNAIIDIDRLGNMKPIKRGGGTGSAKVHNKIDGVITMLMCLGAFISYKR